MTTSGAVAGDASKVALGASDGLDFEAGVGSGQLILNLGEAPQSALVDSSTLVVVCER